MTRTEYEVLIEKFDRSPGNADWYYALGLAGETGEVIEIIKKDNRVKDWRRPLEPGALALELGDVLWYITRLANKHGFTLADLMRLNVEKLSTRHAVGPK